ncbi:aspartate kinase [Candidatus Pseudothioglobus singularis]|uniref:amino acid kinase family protein n=1 Tax=Candidatus Pseudothioglobus singularis TaxID=1427364 RepID=UPI0008062AD7|nr:aspartate kinase [Candidatus Pseudothioglobus singularis]ANQ67044.1 aspartate kinase [Candidatus Pseudothioglobus singularis]
MAKNLAPIVMKFGGTSLRDEDCRSYALKCIENYHESGERIVVVVSAMGRKGEPYATDTLVALLRDVGHNINPRELDLVMSVGETLSSAYFSHLLSHNGMPAESFNGRQSGILTDDNAGNAEILDINPARIVEALDNGFIAVVAGFQGVNDKGDIRTLGRGGSDTSAVALASALGAEKVEIFSDVDGIANCDPRQVEGSSYLESISVNQMLAMADEGSRVIHPRAIKASLKTQTPIIAKNTFNDSEGTLIHHDISKKKEVVAIAHRESMVLIEFALEHKAASHVNGVVNIDSKRLLLNDDVYLSDKLAQLEEKLGFYKLSRHWATISVVFNNKVSKKPAELDYAELLDSPDTIIRYLLKEVKVRETLKFLHGRYTS